MALRSTRLHLTRTQILAFRRSVQALDERLPPGKASLRQAAWAGLQDSMPRAALLSLHARVEGTTATTWEAPSLTQLWGPRYSTYIVDARDAPAFTVGRLPESGSTRRVAESLASRLENALGDARMIERAAAQALGESPNRLRYATLTGRVRIRWDGAKQPTIWIVPPPAIGAGRGAARARPPLCPCVRPSHAGGIRRMGWNLVAGRRSDLRRARSIADPCPHADRRRMDPGFGRAARPPPGWRCRTRATPAERRHVYFLFQRPDERALLVENADHRGRLWTSRVWPGALLVDGIVVGTWRRAEAVVSIETWRRLSRPERHAVEAEAASLPLPGIVRGVAVRWLV